MIEKFYYPFSSSSFIRTLRQQFETLHEIQCLPKYIQCSTALCSEFFSAYISLGRKKNITLLEVILFLTSKKSYKCNKRRWCLSLFKPYKARSVMCTYGYNIYAKDSYLE